MNFSTLTNSQLRDECAARGIPVSGTNPELIDRLTSFEAERQISELPDMGEDDDLLGEAQELPAAPTAPNTTPKVEVPVTAPVQPAQVAPEPKADPSLLAGNRYEITFPCPSELSTGVHQDNCLRARAAAEAAGYQVRGGAYSAARTGFRQVSGTRHAVYEVPIRKE